MNLFINKYFKHILFYLLLVFLAHYVFVFMGVYQNDDVAYMRFAHQLAYKNSLDINSYNHFQHRWVVIFFTAFFYKLFGVNDYSSSFFNLLSVLATYFLLLKILKNQSKILIFLISVLFLFNRAAIFYSHRTLADAPLMCLITLIIYIYTQVKFYNSTKLVLIGITQGFLFFITIVTKESIVITLPFWLYLFIKDVYYKKLIKYWISLIISFSVFAFLYLLIYKVNTGFWLFRLQVLFTNNHLNICSYDVLPFSVTLKRITVDLVDAFIHSSYALIYLPAIFCFIYKKQIFRNNEVFIFIANAFIILLLCSNFMTVSYKAYMPLCHDARHFIFLVPLASILAAHYFVFYLKNSQNQNWFLIIFCMVAIRMRVIDDTFIGYMYVPFALFFLLMRFFKSLRQFLFLSIVLFYCSISLHTFIKQPYPFYLHQKQIIENLLNQKKPTVVYCNNAETLDNAQYMYGFNPRNIDLQLLNENNIVNNFTQYQYYYLINNNNSPNAIFKWNQCLKSRSYVIKKGNVLLFEIKDKNDWQAFVDIQKCASK